VAICTKLGKDGAPAGVVSFTVSANESGGLIAGGPATVPLREAPFTLSHEGAVEDNGE
jgi:hypothetical protein